MNLLTLSLLACTTEPPADLDVYSQAHGCYAVRSGGKYLVSSDAEVAFSTRSIEDATAFRLQPADLGNYLLFDPDGGFVVSEEEQLIRLTELLSDVTLVDDDYVSGAIWALEAHAKNGDELALVNARTGLWLDSKGTVDQARKAASLVLEETQGCAEFPELQLNAEGEITKTTWDDGEVYGFVDTHSHMLTNFGFGGGMYHGAPFHPLGVTHALSDCDVVHGEMGRTDFFGYVFDSQGGGGDDLTEVFPQMIGGELTEDNHDHSGYPDFIDWPHSNERSTHQTQYYKWLERSYLGGLRLVVQHATTNSVICNITVAEGWAPSRYDCEDMTGVDRQLEAVFDMERYIDAQSGGPEQGWFRIVTTPEEARQVIEDGKMAVILGIETSDLFNCHITPREGGPVCDDAYVDGQLDAYYELGVRALFPNHKYDNAFSPGDGSDGFIEVGNFLNSGHYTNQTLDCPVDVPGNFDGGTVSFSGLFEPRDEYVSEPPESFESLDVDSLLPYLSLITSGPLEGDYCQNGTLTPVGEHLINGVMQRGMILEVDHLPKWSYVRAIEMLEDNDYPAVGTHGRDWNGKIFELGGTTFGNFGRCHDPENPKAALNSYNERLQRKIDAGGHPSLGFGFDYNGFAGGPRNRFGEDSSCTDQVDPITYPFTSVAGDITFTEAVAGNRTYDFGLEGMAHIGLIPEYIEDVRKDGATEEDLEPLFRSAEGYIQVWEKAVASSEAGAGQE